MMTLIHKAKNTLVYHYHRMKGWAFPPDMAHSTGYKMVTETYEPEVTEAIRSRLGDGDMFLDVGANVGYFSKLAAGIVGTEGRILALEAEQENYIALARNLASHPNAIAIRAAASDSNAILKLSRSSHSSCHSLMNTGNYSTDTQSLVPSLTLDFIWSHFMDRKAVALLKIDVEGAEPLVLDGAQELLRNSAVKVIIVEYCPRILLNSGLEPNDLFEKIGGNYEVSVLETKHQIGDENGRIRNGEDFQELTSHLLSFDEAMNSNLLCILSE